MKGAQNVIGIEINPKFVGALFTEKIAKTLRVFCFYTNGDTSQFDMPADENLGSLQHFQSRLNLDENCSSVIIDEVVQGRVYVRSEKNYWLYTLLSTPGNVLPPFNADICNLPWRHCWQSKTADVLEYGKSGDLMHCFAIRTQISENDATRQVVDTKAFRNPSSFHKKQPHRWGCLNIAIGLACLVALIGLTVFLNFKRAGGKSPQMQVMVAAGSPVEASAASYYLLSKHHISGPYSVKNIADMNAGGLLDAETMCRPENATEWTSLATLFPQPLSK
jgi:hypothetical protein